MDPVTIGLTALSGGLSFMSALGQKQSTAKQGRLQAMENARVDQLNRDAQQLNNEARAYLGERMLTVPEHESVQTLNFVDIPGFMAGAEKAGFNPVTWLNSGALSMYHSVQTIRNTTGHNAADAFKLMSPDFYQTTPQQIQRVPSMMEVVGGAGTSALNTFQGLYKTQQSQQFQSSLLDRQLAAMGSGFRMPGSSGTGGNASVAGTNISRLGGSGATVTAGLAAGKQPVLPGVELEESKMIDLYPYGWKQDKNFPGAETVEDVYGDAMSWIYGALKMGNDITLNTTKTSAADGLGNWWNGKQWGGAPLQAPWHAPVSRYVADQVWRWGGNQASASAP